jgi:hypothetical protein
MLATSCRDRYSQWQLKALAPLASCTSEIDRYSH